MGCVCGIVAVLLRVVRCAVIVYGSGIRGGAADDFGDETAAERCEVRELEVAVRIWRVLLEVGVFAEVLDGHGGEGGDDDVVVGEVCVKGAVQREGGGVGGQGTVDGGVGRGNVLAREAGEEFLLISDALSATGGVAKGVVVVVFDIQCLLETGPFIRCEEVAEIGGANVGCFVGADGLQGVGVVYGQVETCWSVCAETGGGIGKVDGHVAEVEVVIAFAADRVFIVFEAGNVGCKCVVSCSVFGDDDHVEQGAVGEGGQLWVGHREETRPEETQRPVDLGVFDSRLAGRAKDWFRTSSAIGEGGVVLQLGDRGIVQSASIAIPERHTGEELGIRADPREQTRVFDLVLERVQKGQGTGEGRVGVCRSEVVHFGGESGIVGSVIKGTSRKAFSMSLETVCLLDLAAIGKSHIVDTKIARIVVLVGRDLTCTRNRQPMLQARRN